MAAMPHPRPHPPDLSSAQRADVLAVANQSAAALMRAYGAFALPVHIELDALRVEALVRVCGAQIRRRALDTPLLFSPLALSLSSEGCTSLLRSYLGLPAGLDILPNPRNSSSALPHVPPPEQPIPPAFAQECTFANPVDLAALIKWALSRIGKVVPVPAVASSAGSEPQTLYVQHRGFLLLDMYGQWRATERRIGFSPHAFSLFASQLGANERRLLLTLFSLLSSTVSYSLNNGMTPSRLGRTFGPLLFGLPEDETFSATYAAYVKAGNAAEHLLLAYIREVGATSSLPVRLAQNVKDYVPLMQETADFAQVQHHIKQEPLTVIESDVRLYSPDLIQTACQTPVKRCPEWQACLSDSDVYGRLPQFTARTCRLLNYTDGVQDGKFAPGAPSSAAAALGPLGSDLQPLQPLSGARAASSLSEVEWGSFASLGFENTDNSKFRFDLTESLRSNRGDKHKTMAWSDFEHAGFMSDDDDDLSWILAFDAQLKNGLEQRTDEREAILRRLKEAGDQLPAFTYSTEPRIVSSPARPGEPPPKFDPMFAEVWAEYLIGSGWSNRDDLSHRPANFVVLQYKSLKLRTSSSVGGWQDQEDADPRTEGAWFVVSEVIPSGYRSELETFDRKREKSRSMLRNFSVFKRGKRALGSREDASLPTRSTSRRYDEPSFKLDNFRDPLQPIRPGMYGASSVSSPQSAHLSLNLAPQKSSHSGSSHDPDFDPPSTGSEGKNVSRLTAGGTRLISAIKSRSSAGKGRYLRPLTPGQAGSTDQLPHSPRASPSPFGHHKNKVRHELAGVAKGMASVASRGRRPRKSSFSTVDFDTVSVLETDSLTGCPFSLEDRWVDVQVKQPPTRLSQSLGISHDVSKTSAPTPKAAHRSALVSAPQPPSGAGPEPAQSSSPTPSEDRWGPPSSLPTSGSTRFLASSDSSSSTHTHSLGRARLAELPGSPCPSASPSDIQEHEQVSDDASTPTERSVQQIEPDSQTQLLSLGHLVGAHQTSQSFTHASPSVPGSFEEARQQETLPARSSVLRNRDDPFDKSRSAGRVARLAGQFSADTMTTTASKPSTVPASALAVERAKAYLTSKPLRSESLASSSETASESSPDADKTERLCHVERSDVIACEEVAQAPQAHAAALSSSEIYNHSNGSDSTIGASGPSQSNTPIEVMPIEASLRHSAPLSPGLGLGLSGMLAPQPNASVSTGAGAGGITMTTAPTASLPASPSTLSLRSSSSVGVPPNSFDAPHEWRFTQDLSLDEQEQLVMLDDTSTAGCENDDESPFRERYQPGQPLHSLVEADEESLRSSVTSQSAASLSHRLRLARK